MPVLASEQTKSLKKKQTKIGQIRHSEYYDMQTLFDKLHAKSMDGESFINLIELITKTENIMLAYRNIKRNEGSKTPGVDGRTIHDLANLTEEQFVKLIKKKFHFYRPKAVKRVEIPKWNGKMRPLGIPTITDRIVQQYFNGKITIYRNKRNSDFEACK